MRAEPIDSACLRTFGSAVLAGPKQQAGKKRSERMFDSLNEKIRRSEGKPETAAARLLRYTGIGVAAMLARWALYASMLYLE